MRYKRVDHTDGRGAIRRKQPVGSRPVAVKGVGRFGTRGYCGRCGQKTLACRCESAGR